MSAKSVKLTGCRSASLYNEYPLPLSLVTLFLLGITALLLYLTLQLSTLVHRNRSV